MNLTARNHFYQYQNPIRLLKPFDIKAVSTIAFKFFKSWKIEQISCVWDHDHWYPCETAYAGLTSRLVIFAIKNVLQQFKPWNRFGELLGKVFNRLTADRIFENYKFELMIMQKHFYLFWLLTRFLGPIGAGCYHSGSLKHSFTVLHAL